MILAKPCALLTTHHLRKDDGEEFNETAPLVPPKQVLQVRMKEGSTKTEREDIINGLRNFIPDSTVLVFDTTALLKATQVAIDMLVLFFNIGTRL